MKTAVAFLVFNRPELTSRVFEEIRKAQPQKLLIVADGPRTSHPEDIEKCSKVRAIFDRVDWDCEVLKNYSDVNLGCGIRISSGLEWVFNMVEEAVIVEDDCLPHATFFPYCENLLGRYRDNERIGFIGGVNFSSGKKRCNDSYYFSLGHFIWGWATWRRAWQGYDFHMERWPQLRDNDWLTGLFRDKKVVRYYTYNLNQTHRHVIDTWDYQWFFHNWLNDRWEIMPKVNLVTNIGHDKGAATHTRFKSKIGNVPTVPMEFPLVHPRRVSLDRDLDRFNERDRRMAVYSHVNLLVKKQEITNQIQGFLTGRTAR
jgi:hypothetical protein